MKSAQIIGDSDTKGYIIVGSTQSTVYIEGIFASVNGSPMTKGNTANGSSDVIIENIPANRYGDIDTNSVPLIGSHSVFID